MFLVCIPQISIKQSTFTKIPESIHLFISKLSRIYFKTLLNFLCNCRVSENTIRKIKQDVIIWVFSLDSILYYNTKQTPSCQCFFESTDIVGG